MMNKVSEEGASDASFWEHMEELRHTFIRILLVIFSAFLLCLIFYEPLLAFFTRPLNTETFQQVSLSRVPLSRVPLSKERLYNHSESPLEYTKQPQTEVVSHSVEVTSLDRFTYLIPPGSSIDIEKPKHSLFLFGPLEGLTVVVKTCFWIALIGSSPLWFYFLLHFIKPALSLNERGLFLPFFALSILFVTLGLLFGYFITLPLANQYLLLFSEGLGENLWSLSHYLDFSLFLLLASGIAFEGGLFMLFLVHVGFLTADTLRQKRRYAIVVAFILAALLTPPDVFSQVLLATLLISLYELSIFYGSFKKT
jgi:sec-independent protein translocase protein TatC